MAHGTWLRLLSLSKITMKIIDWTNWWPACNLLDSDIVVKYQNTEVKTTVSRVLGVIFQGYFISNNNFQKHTSYSITNPNLTDTANLGREHVYYAIRSERLRGILETNKYLGFSVVMHTLCINCLFTVHRGFHLTKHNTN